MNYDLYFSEESDSQEGSVEEQLSIMKAIFLSGKSTEALNTSFKLKRLLGLVFFHLLLLNRHVNIRVSHFQTQFSSRKHCIAICRVCNVPGILENAWSLSPRALKSLECSWETRGLSLLFLPQGPTNEVRQKERRKNSRFYNLLALMFFITFSIPWRPIPIQQKNSLWTFEGLFCGIL